MFPSVCLSECLSAKKLFNGCRYQKNVSIKSCHIFKKNKNGCFIFYLFFFWSDPSKWIKLDQTWSNWISHQSKNVTIKSCHIYRKDKNDCFVFWFFGSDLSKMDQTWSNCTSHQSKNVTIKSTQIYSEDKMFILSWIGSNPSKIDQTSLTWIFSKPKMFYCRVLCM